MPKIPVRKQDPSVHTATVKTIIEGVSNIKQNQNVQQAVSFQRNIGLRCSSNNSKTARSNARSGLQPSKSVVVKSSVQQAKRNVASSARKTQSSNNSQHSFVTKANDASEINPGPALPASGNLSYNHESNEIATSFPPKFPSTGGSMQHSQVQTAKPSGLRMPSPSLGFFNQSKVSSSHNILQRSNKACNVPESNIPNLRKFDAFNVIREKPIPAPGKMPDIVSGLTSSANKGVPGSVTESNRHSDSLEKTESNLPGNATQKVELNAPSNFNSFDTVNNEQSFHIYNDTNQKSLKTGEQRTYEKNSPAVDSELQCSDDRLLLRSAQSDQFMKDDAKERVASICPMNIEMTEPKLENAHITSQLDLAVQVQGVFETTDFIDSKCEENKVCHVSIKDHRSSSQSQSGDVHGAVSESQSGKANVYSIEGLSKQHDDLLSCANEENMKQADETMPSTRQVEQIKSESPSPWTNNGTFSRESRSLEFQKCTGTEIANSSTECIAATDNFCKKSQLQSANVSLSAGTGKVVLGSSAFDNMVVDENETIIDADGIELNSSRALCSKQLTWPDSGCDMAVEDPCEDNIKSCFIDTEFMPDIKHHGQTPSGISEMLDKYQEADVFTNGSIEVPDVHSDSGYYSGCEMGNFQCITSQPSTSEEVMGSSEVNDTVPAMQVEGYSMTDEINKHKHVEDKHLNLPLNSNCSDSELRPGDEISYCQQYMSPVQNNQLNYKHVVNNLSIEGKQISEAYDKLLFEDYKPFAEFRESNASKVADVSLYAKSCFDREVEISALFQHVYAKQTNEELAGVGDTIKNTSSGHTEHNESDPVAAQVSLDDHGLSLDDKVIVNNCSSEELQEMNVLGSIVDVVLEHTDACENELSSVVCTQAPPAAKNDGVDEDQKVEYPSEENKVLGSAEIEPLVKNPECYTDTKFWNNEELSSPTWSLTCGVSLKMNEVQNSGTANTCESKAFCSQNKESKFSANTYQRVSIVENIFHILKHDSLPEEASISQNSDRSVGELQHELEDVKYATDNATMSLTGSISEDVNVNTVKITVFPEEVTICENNDDSGGEMQHESEDATMSLTGNDLQEVYVNSMASDNLPEEDETIITQKDGSPNNETQHALDDAIHAIKDKDTAELLKNSGIDRKQDTSMIKPPPHAVPFSDEWLAAFEAAGEEILTLKSGAVQHSPQDKTQPEPGPWSPVKRKNNQGIGPFDCTKFTNIPPPS
ncbi:uncharacterized protein LOC123226292 [Mangifera indica]|uniref:uncharacterized protein LOC123226292 n=1 Tax=Mangifera indica TaxID=29780 RepID=UPI001CFC4438|nr:uncharacterized protein LOC123226292 [Mangifera indica]